MANPAQDANAQHLLIRIRLTEEWPGNNIDRLPVEIEAQVNHAAIYPAGRVDIDLTQLNRAEPLPGNEYGRLLGQKLLSSLPFQIALSTLSRADQFRVQLMLEPAAYPLTSIRWERLEFSSLGSRGSLASTEATPFSRFTSVNREETEPKADTPFHLLVLAASPDGLPRVSAFDEFDNLLKACDNMLQGGWLELTLVPGNQNFTEQQWARFQVPHVRPLKGASSLSAIAQVLNTGSPPFSGIHIIAHGRFVENNFELMLEDEEGFLERARADVLISDWNLAALRLVYLQSCQSAVDASEQDKDPRPHVGGLMQQLIEAGVPGVIAMQDEVRMDDAAHFCRAFYGSLLRDGLADRAVNVGRSAIQSYCGNREQASTRWSIPAFATRLVNASLWVESPIRAAQGRLKRQIEAAWTARQLRDLPIDVLVTSKQLLRQRSFQDDNDFQPLTPQASIAVEAKLTLQQIVIGENDTPAFTCVVGARGRGKTQLLERVFLDWFDSMVSGSAPQDSRICFMLRLADCARPAYDPETTLARAVSTFYESRTGTTLDPRVISKRFRENRFVFLVSGDTNVGPGVTEGLNLLRQFDEDSGKKHRFILTLDKNQSGVDSLPDDTQRLIVQPMRAERVRQFLKQGSTQADKTVLQLLEQSALYDLAEVPWLLNEMLEQARRGVLKQSRAEIIKRVVTDGISRFTGSSAASVSSARVREALRRFAWQVQTRRSYSLPEREAYSILQKLRGNSDYPLSGFLTDMIVSCDILAAVSEEGIGFNYPGFRSYFAAEYLYAKPEGERRAYLEDVTAQLGRQSRAEEWRETLYILAGMWPETGDLLRMILSGSLLHEGEQLFIAARCLQEARLQFHGPWSDEPVVRSILSSLLQLASPGLRSATTRNKAIEHLGPLNQGRDEHIKLDSIRPLVSILLDRRRAINNNGGEILAYDYSGTRLAALKALAYSKDRFAQAVRERRQWRVIPDIEEFLSVWANGENVTCDSKRLTVLLQKRSEPVAAMAAFALALARTDDAFDLLSKSFDDPDTDSESLWPLADSLLELTHPAMRQFVTDRLGREGRHEVLAYMIGKLGSALKNSEEQNFLREHLTSENKKLSGRCMQALGELLCSDVLPWCHDWLRREPPYNSYFALQAMRHIGDWESLQLIESLQWNALRDDPNKRLFLDSVRTEVYEAIYWRLAGGLAREVMDPITASQNEKPKTRKAGA